ISGPLVPPCTVESFNWTDTLSFHIQLSTNTLPFLLYPQDSMIFNICYHPNARKLLATDTVRVSTSCGLKKLLLQGEVLLPQFYAPDITFGNVQIGKTVCMDTFFRNTGDADLELRDTLNMQSPFMLQTKLPVTVHRYDTIRLQFCYTPISSAGDIAIFH